MNHQAVIGRGKSSDGDPSFTSTGTCQGFETVRLIEQAEARGRFNPIKDSIAHVEAE